MGGHTKISHGFSKKKNGQNIGFVLLYQILAQLLISIKRRKANCVVFSVLRIRISVFCRQCIFRHIMRCGANGRRQRKEVNSPALCSQVFYT